MSVAEYLSDLTARLEDQLGERLARAWLVGSGARGDFDPVRSHIDVRAAITFSWCTSPRRVSYTRRRHPARAPISLGRCENASGRAPRGSPRPVAIVWAIRAARSGASSPPSRSAYNANA